MNGYGPLSPGGYNLYAGFLIEIVLTAVFLIVILGSTDDRSPSGFAPIAIGLALTLIHLISIPVTNTWVNPARSTGPALLVGALAMQQVWLFWAAPPLLAARLEASSIASLPAVTPHHPWSAKISHADNPRLRTSVVAACDARGF